MATDGSEADDDGRSGPLTDAKVQAFEMARRGATDAEIEASLRVVLCAVTPQKVPPVRLARAVASWAASGYLEDARVAGEVEARKALHEAASKDGSGSAALYLARRSDLLEGLGVEVERARRRILGMSERELAAEIRRWAEALGVEL